MQPGWRACRTAAASGLALLGQTDPAWPEVMIRTDAAGEEICGKHSSTGMDREPGRAGF